MPPSPQPPIDTDHMLSAHQKQPAGPIIGTIIVVILLVLGALYFLGARLNRQAQQVPYIPAGTTTVPVSQ